MLGTRQRRVETDLGWAYALPDPDDGYAGELQLMEASAARGPSERVCQRPIELGPGFSVGSGIPGSREKLAPRFRDSPGPGCVFPRSAASPL